MIKIKGGEAIVNLWEITPTLFKQLKELDASFNDEFELCIHCGVEGTHCYNSFHYKGLAVDMHFEKGGEVVQPASVFLHTIKNWRGGIGIYTCWHQKGFHLDTGPVRTWWQEVKNMPARPLVDFLKEYPSVVLKKGWLHEDND